MRKLLLVAVLGLISFAICFAAEPPGREYGVGAPYSITASATGVIYRDLNTGVLWQANSTTKGDWSKLTPQVADGSASAPYNTLYVTTINGVNVFTAAEKTQALVGSTTVDFLAEELTASETVSNILTLTPSDWPATPTAGLMFVASTSKALMLHNGTSWYTIDLTPYP